MTINQRRSYTEMLEILDNKEFLKSRVPKALIEKMQLEKDNDWNFKYDETVSLENQNILYSTKTLYSYIYTKYIATEQKRRELESIYEQNARTKYNPDNLFKMKNSQEKKADEFDTNLSTETNIIVVEEKWYKKVLNIIKSIFKRN